MSDEKDQLKESPKDLGTLQPGEVELLSNAGDESLGADPSQFDLESELANQYLAHASVELTDGSVATYESRLRHYIDSLHHGFGIDVLNAERRHLIKYYRICAVNRNHRPSTLKGKRSVIGELYSYIQIHTDCTPEITQTEVKKALTDQILQLCEVPIQRKHISHDELVKLYQATKNPRNELICRVIYETGGRRDDVRHLKIRDVDVDELSIVYPDSKGGKRYKVPIRAELALRIEQWIDVQRKSYPDHTEHDYLFPSQDGGELSDGWVTNIVKSAAKRAGIQDILGEVTYPTSEGLVKGKIHRVTPHTLRHSIITHLKEQSLDRELRRLIAGHSSHETTREYYEHNTGEGTSTFEVLRQALNKNGR